MPFNNIISRTDAAALIPEDVASGIIDSLPQSSAALSLFRQVRMPTLVQRMPVVTALPVAYWVNGDTGLKQTTEMAWGNQFIQAEEMAAIIAIPEAVIDDSTFDAWGSVRPRLEEALGRLLDAAVFFGASKPASWTSPAIVPGAIAAGNTNARDATAAEGGVSADISDTFALVEADGYGVTGVVANGTYRGILRNARNGAGNVLPEVNTQNVYGVPVRYAMAGQWPTGASAVELIAGQTDMAIIGVRQDFTYKVLDQAVITDDTGAVIFNLPQQDMLALRVVARFGYAVANPINYAQPTAGSRFPFAVQTAPA